MGLGEHTPQVRLFCSLDAPFCYLQANNSTTMVAIGTARSIVVTGDRKPNQRITIQSIQ